MRLENVKCFQRGKNVYSHPYMKDINLVSLVRSNIVLYSNKYVLLL